MSDATEAKAEPKIEWRIAQGKVGPVELGKKLPDVVLARDLEKLYLARYIADAQPIDAFQLDDPPLLIVLEGGPYSEAAKEGDPSAMSPTDKYRGAAAKAARGGTPVRAVFVMGPGPTTEAGVGVGSTLDDLKRALPDIKLAPIPETFGKDMCVGRAKSLPGVGFVFATCGKANKGEAVVRVDLVP